MFQFDTDKVRGRPNLMVYIPFICRINFDLKAVSNFQYHSINSSSDDDHLINDQITLIKYHHYGLRKN